MTRLICCAAALLLLLALLCGCSGPTPNSSAPAEIPTVPLSEPPRSTGSAAEASPESPEAAPCFDWLLSGTELRLMGPGSVDEADLVIPARVSVTALPCEGFLACAPELRRQPKLLQGCGQGYAPVTAEGRIIESRAELEAESAMLTQLLVYDLRLFRNGLQGEDFAGMRIQTEDGTRVTANNVSALLQDLPCSRQTPQTLRLLSRTDTRLAEDPVRGQVYDVIVMGNAFAGCDALRTVRFEPGIRFANNSMYFSKQGMFENCAALEAVYGIPEDVSCLDHAFLNCVSLREAPLLPASLQSMSDAFAGCSALTAPPEIPAQVTVMTNSFAGCSALASAPLLPEGVQNLQSCFEGCTALTAIPALPDSVTQLRSAFRNCTGLTGVPTLPGGLLHFDASFRGCTGLSGELRFCSGLARQEILDEAPSAFTDCPGITGLTIEHCGAALDPSALNELFPVRFSYEHQGEGLCPVCRKITCEETVQGLHVRFNLVSESSYQRYESIVRDEIPDTLRKTCHELIYTYPQDPEIAEYLNPSNTGLAFDQKAYILDKSFAAEAEGTGSAAYTTFHELGHCYDDAELLSIRDAWRDLHEEDGLTLAQNFYSLVYYNRLEPLDQRRESFACAVGAYYDRPELLQSLCPKTYAFLEQELGPPQ